MKPFVKHILAAVLYYILGIAITWFVYKLSGTPYAHGINLYHLVGLLCLVGGIVWAFIAIAHLPINQGHGGALLIHILVIAGFVLMVVNDVNKSPDVVEKPDPKERITVYRDSASNSSVIVDGTGDTLYLNRNDSVLINKIDSAQH